MERFVPHSFKSLLSLVLAVAIASQTLAFYPSQSQAASLTIPLPSKRSIISCVMLLTAAALTGNAGGPVSAPLPEISISQPVAKISAQAVSTQRIQAQAVIRVATQIKVTELLGSPSAEVSPSQLQIFRTEWSKLIQANAIAGTIPSKAAFDSWWIQHEDMIIDGKSAFPKDITLQRLFMHSATAYMVDSHPAPVVVAWSEKTQANQTLAQASPDSGSWLNWIFATLGSLAFGALAAGPVSNFLNLAIKPKVREFEVKWQRGWENIWAYISKLTNSKDSGEKVVEVNEPDAELTPEQIRRAERAKLSRIQRTRAYLNGLGYSAKPRVLMMWENTKQILWDTLYAYWQNVYTATQREGRDRVLDSTNFRPSHFAERASASLSRAEVEVQGFEGVRRDVLLENPKNIAEIRATLDELSINIHDMKYYEIRDPVESKKYSSNIETAKARLLELGASPEQVSRLVKTRSYVYHYKRQAVFNLFLHLKHETSMTEWNQGLPDEILNETLEVRAGLGLDDFHREFNQEVIAVAQDLDYDLETFENSQAAYIALLDEPQRAIVKDKPVMGPVKRPVRR